jgi:hypothetical protein
LNLNVNQIDALTIASTGQVNISSSIASNTILNITNGTAGGSGILIQAGNSYANYAMKVLNAAGAEKLRLDGNGNLLVGYTTDQGYKFGVNGTSLFAGAALFESQLSNSSQTYNLACTNSSGGGATVLSTMSNAGGFLKYGLEGNTAGATFASSTAYSVVMGTPTAQGRSFHFATNGNVRMTIDQSGNIGAPTGTNIYNASDVRLKQNITVITDGLSKIKALNPVKFNWVDGFVESEEGKDMLGFIAQEVQAVIPEAVESFGGNSVNIGETLIENPLRVNEKFIIPILVKAIQEQQAQIEELKKIVATK